MMKTKEFRFRCVKDYEISDCDEQDNTLTIKAGTIWVEKGEATCSCSRWIRYENDEYGWIEIPWDVASEILERISE